MTRTEPRPGAATAAGPRPRRGQAGKARRAFTLFEIAISLVIVSFAIVSVIMLFPLGIRAQTVSRFQVYATAKAMEMVTTFSTCYTDNGAGEVEAPNPWDVPVGHGNLAPDLERRLSSYRFGIFPLPLSISQRLDSDGDEIQGILSEGGYLYYSQPLATTGFRDSAIPDLSPNEAQRLIFAVSGYAQQNAIDHFPWKAWPYYVPYPSPPAHGFHLSETGFSTNAGAQTLNGTYLWEDTSDADIGPVFWVKAPGGMTYGYKDYFTTLTLDSAKRYCQAALWYCARKQLPTTLFDTTVPLTAFQNGTPWQQVQGLRFLAHAATCLTKYVSRATLAGAGVALDPVDLTGSGTVSAAFTVTLDKLTALHESCMNLAMLFAASFPYDWSVPRPLNRAIMMDHPLLQYDLFAPLLSGTIFGTGIAASQWRPLSAQPVVNIGRSFQFMDDGHAIDPALWSTETIPAKTGAEDHFTLCKQFQPAERCRQLVFWTVDWTNYEDFETAPSAPIEASKYPRAAPHPGQSFTGLMESMPFMDWQQFDYRNPEKVIAFTRDVSGLPSGSDVSALVNGSQANNNSAPGPPGNSDHGTTAAQLSCFCGVYGADRNNNKVLDRGPVPKSVRMRAIPIARFNYYDGRVLAPMR